jgi:hypothetical protein
MYEGVHVGDLLKDLLEDTLKDPHVGNSLHN